MTATTEELVLERDGAVLVLRLNRPDARNALTPGLIAQLGAAMITAEADPDVRAVVVTGSGDRAFCAGMDLRAFANGETIEAGDATAAYYRLLAGEITVPLVGAANGTAIGGGLELLLGCDVIVAAELAKFGFPEVRRGLFPAGGGTNLGRRVPLGVALEMTLTGDLVDATRAYELGLVNAVTASHQVLATALEFAGRIARNAPLGLAATKELVRLGVTDPARAGERGREWQRVVFASEDAREGAAAFVEKREPRWRGR
ncbi:enoyl-CoA hydratase-related protein [Actinophytocola oryzae]|uniref:Short chain enoyl-CoA hydratase n=1 Tax=Actinophytocola oryzae TaxID=502181 RepID=A0A4R7VKS8_9PSEU|nr:enoyl-CoA hydratase-related protein [Actinophytocola oryzae]TDV49857.1 short chain enoyl-CoA hydratase [Actinophytocola oryzae]